MKKTKIVCTIGPASENEATMKKMMEAGMNVVRLNFSHGSYEEHQVRLDMALKISAELKTSVAIMLDTKGPEIRTGMLKAGLDKVTLKEGQTFTLKNAEGDGDETFTSISHKELYKWVKPNNRILMSDGLIAMRVTEVKDKDIVCVVENGGSIGSRKNMNVPGVSVPMAFLSDKDKKDLEWGVKNRVDFVAASFTRSGEDVKEMREYMRSLGENDAKIISKIENHQGMDNLDDIIREADGIMVARGDLGVEVPFDMVPIYEQEMIRKARDAGKVVICATQMLESMTQNPRPTRAEVTDVAFAVMLGADAVMLSGETAAGAHPVEAVKTMAKIAETTENSIDYWKEFYSAGLGLHTDGGLVGTAIGHAACDVASCIKAKAIVALTTSGYSAHAVARNRPGCLIFVSAADARITRRLSILWGCYAFQGTERGDFPDMFKDACEGAKQAGFLKEGDLAVFTGGMPGGTAGGTNFLKAHRVGEPII